MDPAGRRRRWTDVAELPTVDGIVVATPATTHAEVVGPAARPGRAGLLREAVHHRRRPRPGPSWPAGGDRIHLMHVWRYHPGIERLGELARSGALGRVLGVRSTRVNGPSPRLDTDPVWTLVPHDLTVAIEVLGPHPRAAGRRGRRRRRSAARALWALCGADPWLVIEASTRHPTSGGRSASTARTPSPCWPPTAPRRSGSSGASEVEELPVRRRPAAAPGAGRLPRPPRRRAAAQERRGRGSGRGGGRPGAARPGRPVIASVVIPTTGDRVGPAAALGGQRAGPDRRRPRGPGHRRRRVRRAPGTGPTPVDPPGPLLRLPEGRAPGRAPTATRS